MGSYNKYYDIGFMVISFILFVSTLMQHSWAFVYWYLTLMLGAYELERRIKAEKEANE